MEYYDDIEEYKGGGRISPKRSATDFLKGTLGVGENGNVWINQPDKNGRLSWKATHITKDFRVVSFGFWNDEIIDFKIMVSGYEFFLLRYAYNQDSYIRISYPDDGNDYEKEANLQELLDFFNDKFDAQKFDLLNTDPNYKGTTIKQQVDLLLRRLMVLITNKGLRNFEAPKTDEKPETPEPKFKIGDKVKRKYGNQVMTIVKQSYNTTQKEWDYDLVFDDGGATNSLFESSLEAYSEKTPFQQIDFLSPSTEENDVLIKAMGYYSDGLTFVNSRLANLKIKLKDRIGYLEVLFDEVNNIIKISEPSKNINVWSTAIQQAITNENITEITNLYFATLEKFIEIAEAETPSKECEADASEIRSGQVKNFYDLNKTRIDKLDSKFSCKIIQALVYLSIYESCGSPSSSSLPKAKNNLLSQITNLKL